MSYTIPGTHHLREAHAPLAPELFRLAVHAVTRRLVSMARPITLVSVSSLMAGSSCKGRLGCGGAEDAPWLGWGGEPQGPAKRHCRPTKQAAAAAGPPTATDMECVLAEAHPPGHRRQCIRHLGARSTALQEGLRGSHRPGQPAAQDWPVRERVNCCYAADERTRVVEDGPRPMAWALAKSPRS